MYFFNLAFRVTFNSTLVQNKQQLADEIVKGNVLDNNYCIII